MSQESPCLHNFITEAMCGSSYNRRFMWRKSAFSRRKGHRKESFAENLAGVFNRPRWDVSFHVNMDAASLIGTDTFSAGEVTFRPGPVYTAAKTGGFAVLDEINMAKSEAMAVLHATLDFRRTIDVPGYDRLSLHPATRFIATMNYGYAGTKELNEALVSRFAVIRMPMISKESLVKLIKEHYPTIREAGANELAEVFLELHTKVQKWRNIRQRHLICVVSSVQLV